MSKYYHPSGKISPTSFLYFALTLFVILPILSTVYSLLMWYIPFIYVKFFITIGLGIAVGYVVKRLIIGYGKVRNVKLSIVFGFLSGTMAIYLSYVVWIVLLMNMGETNDSDYAITTNFFFTDFIDIALNPSFVFETSSLLIDTGTWGFGDTAISGILLIIIWIIEFLIVVVLAILNSYDYAMKPFCEWNNTWFEKENLPAFKMNTDPQTLIKNIENDETTCFDNIYLEPNAKSVSHSGFILYSSLKGENFLNVFNNIAKIEDKGINFDQVEIVNYIQLEVELKKQLLERKNAVLEENN